MEKSTEMFQVNYSRYSIHMQKHKINNIVWNVCSDR